GTSRELKASVGSGVMHVQLLDARKRERARDLLADHLLTNVHLEADPTALTIQFSDSRQATYALAELPRAGIELGSFSLGQPSLDEVFLALTGHHAEPEAAPSEHEGASQ